MVFMAVSVVGSVFCLPISSPTAQPSGPEKVSKLSGGTFTIAEFCQQYVSCRGSRKDTSILTFLDVYNHPSPMNGGTFGYPQTQNHHIVDKHHEMRMRPQDIGDYHA